MIWYQSQKQRTDTIMSFLDSLPDELIVRIFQDLIEDPTSYRNFMITSRRCQKLGNSANLVNSPRWTQCRPTRFSLELALDSYRPELCESHGKCAEHHARTKTKCELMYPTDISKDQLTATLDKNYHKRLRQHEQHRSSTSSGWSDEVASTPRSPDHEGTNENDDYDCYYHRLYAMMQSRHITFSSLKFTKVNLSDRGCLGAFRDGANLTNDLNLQKIKLRALVELELDRCDITLDWLNIILSELEHVTYLTMNEVSFTDPTLLVESRHMASHKLKVLKITGDRSCRMNDSIFMYFLEHFPAQRLDLSGTRIEYHKRIIQRFYSSANTLDLYLMRPSEYIFTFPMILMYLKKFQSVVMELVVDDTDITLVGLKRILQDDSLQHLRVSVRNCPLINQFERTRLTNQVDERDLRRVIF